jgi:hypothetical protein
MFRSSGPVSIIAALGMIMLFRPMLVFCFHFRLNMRKRGLESARRQRGSRPSAYNFSISLPD